MKKNKTSIKLTLLLTLVIFSTIILVFIWIFQILFLNTMYEANKTNSLKSSIISLKDAYNNDDYKSIYDELTHNEDICVELINDNVILYSSSTYNKKCLSKNNNALREFQSKFISNNEQTAQVEIINPSFNNKTLVYGEKIKDNVYIFINTSLVPLDDSINLLKSQFVYIALGILFFAIVISIFISNHISKPIEELNKGVRKLKNKDYEVVFNTQSAYIEINELSETLNETVKELSKTDELRRDLMANVSHDLKTPLTMIKAYAEAARDLNNNNEEKRKDNLNIIIEETERLNILVNDILELSKLESNVSLDKKEIINLTSLINEILNRYKILTSEGYKFIFDQKQDIYIKADKKSIEQVIYNLISNAINYTGDDKLIYVYIEKLNKENIRVKVKDTGAGINKKEINLIWDKYYKNEKKHKRNKYGTGLGLSIVKNIFIKHNFNYGVESTNKGTTFYFDIKKINKNKEKNQ